MFHQWIIKPGTVAADALLQAPLNPLKSLVNPTGLNGDSWDAYTAERSHIINHLRTNNIQNTVFITGDVHSSWVADITDDPNNPLSYNPVNGAGSVASEFVITSVTSPGLDVPDQVIQAIRVSSPHIKYVNVSQRGYGILKLNAQEARCEYWYVDTIQTRSGSEKLAATAVVKNKGNKIASV